MPDNSALGLARMEGGTTMNIRMEDYEVRHLAQLRQSNAECTLFLKRSGKLPLPGAGEVALYGSGARHTVKGGTGSGEVNSRFFTTVEQGLEQAGFRVTTKDWLDRYDELHEKAYRDFLKELRRAARKAHTSVLVQGMGAAMRSPEYRIPLEKRCNTAVYVLSRSSGEGSDRKVLPGDVLLTESEIRDILALQKLYPVFLLVLNVGGPVDLTPILAETEDILLLGQLGVETGAILADILLGTAYPSGKLATTWARPDSVCPAAQFGQKEETRYGEGIYVGYRYFDSAGIAPVFPFGFGLGYTDFTVEAKSVSVAGDLITVSAEVRNTGAFPGKQVVQLYVTSPWGRLDQPYQALAAFAKTGELPCGGSCRIELQFRMADLAGFDESRQAYVLEKGDYVLRCGDSSRSAPPIALLRLTREVITRQVKAKLGQPDFADWRPEKGWAPAEGLPVYNISPDALSAETVSYEWKALPDSRIQALSDEELVYLNIGGFRLKERSSVVGDSGSRVAGSAGETTRVLRDVPSLVMADGPAGLRLAPDYYEDETGAHTLGSAMQPTMADLLPKPVQWLADRPKKLPKGKERKHQYTTAIPIGTAIAQSFNVSYAESCGDIVGSEMERFGVHLWLAPALNIHRSILCGRNFEYFSEDPLVSGLMAAAITRGVQKHPGRGVTIKHFAANNQEYNRYNNNSLVSQRALREIYLKGFGLCIRESQPCAVMTSYNLINGVHTSESRELTQDILRCEFGFRGIVMTDWVVGGSMLYNSKKYPMPNAGKVAAAGGDLFMPGCRGDYNRCLAALRSGVLTRVQLEQNATRVLHLAKRLTGR